MEKVVQMRWENKIPTKIYLPLIDTDEKFDKQKFSLKCFILDHSKIRPIS